MGFIHFSSSQFCCCVMTGVVGEILLYIFNIAISLCDATMIR